MSNQQLNDTFAGNSCDTPKSTTSRSHIGETKTTNSSRVRTYTIKHRKKTKPTNSSRVSKSRTNTIKHRKKTDTMKLKNIRDNLPEPTIVNGMSFDAAVVKSVHNGYMFAKRKDGVDVFIPNSQRMCDTKHEIYDVVYGISKMVKTKYQFHNVVSAAFFNGPNFHQVAKANKCKSLITVLGKTDKAIKRGVEMINKKPKLLKKAINLVMNNKDVLLGKPDLKINSSLQVPQFENKNMIKFLKGVLNTDVPDTVLDKSQPKKNKTAAVFNKFGLEIQEYTNDEFGIYHKSLSNRDKKKFTKTIVSEDNIRKLMDNKDFITTMKDWVNTNNFLNCFYTRIAPFTWVNADSIEVPASTKNVIDFLASKKGVTPTDMLFSLFVRNVEHNLMYPFALKVHSGSVGELVLAIMSKVSDETRMAIQPIMQDTLKKSLESLCIDNGFVENDELKVNFRNVIYALKHIGRSSSHSGQDTIRSTTNKNNILGSFIAQLVITSHTHKSEKLDNSLYGNKVNPFCLNTWTNSEELKKHRAMMKIRGWVNMLRLRKIFKMHLVAVEQILELHSLPNVPECSSETWRYFIANIRTSYGPTVKEMRIRHYKRMLEENIGPLKSQVPIVQDLRTFLFNQEDDTKNKKFESSEVESSESAMVDEQWMKRERLAQTKKSFIISRNQKDKRRLQEIKDEIYNYDISEDDAKFYVMNRNLVDNSYGDTLEEKLDNAHFELENDDELMYSDESDDETDDEY